jgi:hypothetical protein
MPATSRYPGESDDAFKARMMQSHPGAFGMGINVPPLPSAQPQASPGMLAGMGGPPPPVAPPMGPSAPDPMQAVMAQGPTLDPLAQGPPKPPVDPAAMPQDVLDSLAGVPVDQAQLLGLEEQRERANALRDTALPEGRQAGRTFVAANPLEFIGAGIKQYRGGKESERLQKEIGTTRGTIGTKQGTYTKEAAKRGGLDVIVDKFRKKKSDDED